MDDNGRLEHTEWRVTGNEFLTSPQMVDRIASQAAQIAELKAALDGLYASFQHDGSQKAKSAVIAYPEVRAALNSARALLAKYA